MASHRTGPETKRLLQRAFTVDDAAAYHALNGNPEVMRWTGEPPIESVEQARAAIAAYPDFESVGYGRWACVWKETHRIIGFSGLKYLPELDAVDVGYRFLPENAASIRVLEKVGMQKDGEVETEGVRALQYSLMRTRDR